MGKKADTSEWMKLRKQGKIRFLTAGKAYRVLDKCDLFGLGARIMLVCDDGKKRHFWAKQFDRVEAPR